MCVWPLSPTHNVEPARALWRRRGPNSTLFLGGGDGQCPGCCLICSVNRLNVEVPVALDTISQSTVGAALTCWGEHKVQREVPGGAN